MKWLKAKRTKTMICIQHFQKFSNVSYKTSNKPKLATTHPKPPPTSQNQPQPTKANQNQPQLPKTTHNQPKLPATTQDQS